MGLSLVTKAEYKAYVGIKGEDQDASIDSLIPKTSELIKNYCRRSFVDYVNDAKVETFNGGTSKLLLREDPVISIVGVGYSTDYGQNYTDLVEFTDYAYNIEDNSIAPISATEFAYGLNAYQVSYYAGYEVLPEDLKLAVFDLVTFYIKNDAVVKNLRIPTTQTMQLEYVSSGQFPSHIARVLNLYKSSWD